MTTYFVSASGSDNTDRQPLRAENLADAKRKVEARWADGFRGDRVLIEIDQYNEFYELVALYIIGIGWDF